MAFSNLDLTGEELLTGRVLRPGLYRVVTKDAKYDAKDSAREAAIVTFEDQNGFGQITEHFNYRHPNPDATSIGRRKLLTFLTHAGHPRPTQPGDVNTLNGLTLLISVVQNGTYEKNGKTLENFEISQFMPDRADAKTGPTNATAAPANRGSRGPQSFDDEIPF